jgi:hypothetical protein
VRLVRCKRAGIRRLRAARCDPWRAVTADSEGVCAQQGWTRCCCATSRRARRAPLSTFGSDERRSVEAQTRLTLGSASSPPLAAPTTLLLHRNQYSILLLSFSFYALPHLYTMSKRARRDSESDECRTSSVDLLVPPGVQTPSKYKHLETSASNTINSAITCALPPHHPIKFDTYHEYETHYYKSHVFRCLECAKNFPTDHFLSLHIAETHDPLNRVKRDRGEKTYHCFVEDCEKVCSTPQKRRMHLVDKHMFPRNFDFHIVNHGSDNRTSLLRPESTSHQKQNNARKTYSPIEENTTGDASASDLMDTEQNKNDYLDRSTEDKSMDDIADSMAALKFVPKSITFGRSRQRGGFSRS